MSKKNTTKSQQKEVSNSSKKTNRNATSPPKDIDKNNAIFYKVLWFGLFGFMIFIFLKVLKNDPLSKVDPLELTSEAFFSKSYQDASESRLLAKPFITDFKKLKIDFDYEHYGIINLDDAYKGKSDYIFGELMTRAYFGDDYVGDEVIKEQVRKAKYVQDKLKEQGIELLLMFAPGKSSIYTEFLPDNVLKTKKKISNYEAYVKECKSKQVNVLDFVHYFKKLKPTSKYPLFPKYGSHWSYYGECLVVDTTIKRLEKMMGVNLPSISFNDFKMLDTTRFRDGDIYGKAGLVVPKGDSLAYPASIGFEQGPGIKPEKILAIADSYFRGFFYIRAMLNTFADSKQWYYYNSIVPESIDNPEVWELDLKAEILSKKAILIMCNEANLKNLGNGFIDDAYELFSNPKQYYANKQSKDKISKFKKQIRNDNALLTKLTTNAQQRGITLDSMITEKAFEMNRKTVKK